jgi:hypothetical protein
VAPATTAEASQNPEPRRLLARQLDADRNPADHDPEKPHGAKSHPDGQEELTVAAAGLSDEDAAEGSREEPPDGV